MPKEIHSDPPKRWDGGDWFYASACATFSATPLQIAASAGAGNINYISSIHFASTSAQDITIWDGASASIIRFYIPVSGSYDISFPRGMELRIPTAGSNIKALSNASATTYYTIAGFYQPWIA